MVKFGPYFSNFFDQLIHGPLAAILLALCSNLPTLAFACPAIGGIVDINCDGKIKFAVAGDSIVKGVGNINLTGDKGG